MVVEDKPTESYNFQCAFISLRSSPGELKGKVPYGIDDDDNDSNHVGKDLERPLTKKTIVTVEGTESFLKREHTLYMYMLKISCRTLLHQFSIVQKVLLHKTMHDGSTCKYIRDTTSIIICVLFCLLGAQRMTTILFVTRRQCAGSRDMYM